MNMNPNDSNNSITIPCTICMDKIAIYRCPGCFERTCSLSCCKVHKEKSGCSGKRNRVGYVPLYQFNDSTLSSDYHFLEDVLAKSERGKRLIKEMGASMNSCPKSNKRFKMDSNKTNNKTPQKDVSNSIPIQPLLSLKVDDVEGMDKSYQSTQDKDVVDETDSDMFQGTLATKPVMLTEVSSKNSIPAVKSTMEENNLLSTYPPYKQNFVRQAHERGIRVLLMPPGMQRHIMNKSTKYDVKKDLITWKVEFIIHLFTPKENDKIIGKQSQGESSKLILTLDRIPESDSLYEHLSKLFERNTSHAAPALNRATLLHFCDSSNTKILRDDVCVLMKRIPCKSSCPTYKRLNLTEPLRDILQGTTVIEYPSIEVVREEDLGRFSVFIEEIIQ